MDKCFEDKFIILLCIILSIGALLPKMVSADPLPPCSVTSDQSSPCELIRDSTFAQGFVFESSDYVRQYRLANKEITQAGLIPIPASSSIDGFLNIDPNGTDDGMKMTGTNRLGAWFEVPPWRIQDGCCYGISSTPYSAANDYATSGPYAGYPLGGIENCPDLDSVTGECRWIGTSVHAAINPANNQQDTPNTVLVSLIAGVNSPNRQADIKFRLNQMGQFLTWGADGYWRQCTDVTSVATAPGTSNTYPAFAMPTGGISNHSSNCVASDETTLINDPSTFSMYYTSNILNNFDASLPVQVTSHRDHFQTDMLYQTGLRDESELVMTQALNPISDLNLADMASLDLSGDIKLVRHGRIDFTTAGTICNAEAMNHNRWDNNPSNSYYNRWVGCYVRSTTAYFPGWDMGVYDIGIFLRNNATNQPMWIGIINGTDTLPDVFDWKLSGNYKTGGCVGPVPTNGETVADIAIPDTSTWYCAASVIGFAFVRLPSFIFYNAPNTPVGISNLTLLDPAESPDSPIYAPPSDPTLPIPGTDTNVSPVNHPLTSFVSYKDQNNDPVYYSDPQVVSLCTHINYDTSSSVDPVTHYFGVVKDALTGQPLVTSFYYDYNTGPHNPNDTANPDSIDPYCEGSVQVGIDENNNPIIRYQNPYQTPVYAIQTPNTLSPNNWVNFDTNTNGHGGLLGWIQYALDQGHILDPSFDNNIADYRLDSFGVSLEQGTPVDTEIQMQNISLHSTYKASSETFQPLAPRPDNHQAAFIDSFLE